HATKYTPVSTSAWIGEPGGACGRWGNCREEGLPRATRSEHRAGRSRGFDIHAGVFGFKHRESQTRRGLKESEAAPSGSPSAGKRSPGSIGPHPGWRKVLPLLGEGVPL